jgi:hypothetical protein
MKWGIRRTPEQLGYKVRRQAHDLTAKTIPAGTKCFRIATKDDPGVARGKDTYIAYLPVDRANIRSITPWLMSVRGKTLDDAYEREYEITKDIKVASYEEVAAIRRELMAKPEYREEAAGNYTDNRMRQCGWDMTKLTRLKELMNHKVSYDEYAERELQREIDYWKDVPKRWPEWKDYAKDQLDKIEAAREERLADQKDRTKKWVDWYKQTEAETNEVLRRVGSNKLSEVTEYQRGLANMAMDAVYGKEGINKQTLQTELKKRGYNAMYDNAMISINSANSQEAYEPLILFDGGGTLKETGGKFLSREEVRTAENDFSKWREGVEKDARKKRIAS